MMIDFILSIFYSTAATSALIGLIVFLFRNVLIARLNASVTHEFNQKLEELRSELRKSEAEYNSELKKKELQIEAIRSAALSGALQRNSLLATRRQRAAAKIWSAAIDLGPQRVAAELVKVINVDGAAQAAAENPRAREALNNMLKVRDLDEKTSRDPDKLRPFVSPNVWALFSAFRAVITFAMLQLKMVRMGVNQPNWLNPDAVKKFLKIALPERTAFIDEQGSRGFPYLLDEIESRLLDALHKDLSGSATDNANIEQALAITRAVDEATLQFNKGAMEQGAQPVQPAAQ